MIKIELTKDGEDCQVVYSPDIPLEVVIRMLEGALEALRKAKK